MSLSRVPTRMQSVLTTEDLPRMTKTLMPAGSVLQVVQATKTNTQAMSGGTFVDIDGLTVNITPTSVNSKILFMWSINMGSSLQHHQHSGRLVRSGTVIFVADTDGSRNRTTFGSQDSGTTHGATYNYAGQYLDSPATTTQLTYKIQMSGEGGTTWINRGNEADGDNVVTQRLASSITVMEIAG